MIVEQKCVRKYVVYVIRIFGDIFDAFHSISSNVTSSFVI